MPKAKDSNENDTDTTETKRTEEAKTPRPARPVKDSDAATPVRVKKLEKPVDAAVQAPKTSPKKSSALLWYRQWWVYAGAGAVLIIVVGIGWMTFGGKGNANSDVTNGDEMQNVNSYTPSVFDLEGGDRLAKDHIYPLAMMIDNSEAARPQSGLQGAAIVYEALVEGGITRFMAVFDRGLYDQMGPVRSSRPYFLEWLAEYDAAYAHAGGSPEALTSIRRDRVHDINGIGNAAKAFFRDKTRPAPHNLYTKLFNMIIWLQANKLDVATPSYTPWTFGSTLPSTGTPATSVDIFFTGTAKSTQATFTYDATKQLWLRSTAGKPHQDRLTNAQIGVTNVIVQRISNQIGVGEKGRLTMTVTGTGTAKLFQQGKVFDVQWSKADANSRTTFTYADGTPVVFLSGNTWVEVLPSDRTVAVK